MGRLSLAFIRRLGLALGPSGAVWILRFRRAAVNLRAGLGFKAWPREGGRGLGWPGLGWAG